MPQATVTGESAPSRKLLNLRETWGAYLSVAGVALRSER